MKILIVNYYYPPLIDAHSYRWEQIARFWVESGHQVDVITGRVKEYPKYSVDSGVSVIRVGVFAKNVSTPLAKGSSNSLMRQLSNGVLNFFRPLYRKLYWPDSAWHWIPSVTYAVFKRRGNNYDLVVSYYPCFATHIAISILRLIKKNPNFTWVADYGDPFSTSPTMPPNNYHLYDGLNRWVEKRLAASVDFMVFTNEATANAYKQVLGIDNKIQVIPHLVKINDYYSAENANANANANAITLCYIGGFHKNIREPNRLFDLVRMLNQFGDQEYNLKIYGPLNSFTLNELSPHDCKNIQYMGPIKRIDAVNQLRNADVIVNVDNDNCVMTPSKVVECISTGRPLINISNETIDYKPLLEYAKIGYVISITANRISKQNALDVVDFIQSHRANKSAPLDSVLRVLESHTLEVVANRYLLLIV